MMHAIRSLSMLTCALLFTLWAGLALWIDVAPWLSVLYCATQLALLVYAFRARRLRKSGEHVVEEKQAISKSNSPWRSLAKRWGISAFIVLCGWLGSIHPSDDRDWAIDYRFKPSVKVNGSMITIEHYRDFRYLEGTTVVPNWKTVQVSLDDLVSLDLFLDYWGSPYIAHPLLSFGFKDGQQVVFSIETRREVHESYSALKGFFRQFELIYLAGSESDLLNLRLHHRQEELYWYPIRISAPHLKDTFMDFVKRFEALEKRPEFYHAITSNCTTNLRSQSSDVRPWDYRILVNGLMDKMFFDRGFIQAKSNIPFEEYKKGQRIHREKVDRDLTGEAYSKAIRAGILQPDLP